MNTIDYFGLFMKALTVEKVTGTFVSVTFLVESAICTLSKILLLTKERASTPVIYAPWFYLSERLKLNQCLDIGNMTSPSKFGEVT